MMKKSFLKAPCVYKRSMHSIRKIFVSLLYVAFYFSPMIAESKTIFAICVCSYNNEKYVEWNLGSLFYQNYDEDKFHIYYMNDMSTDETFLKAKAYAQKTGKEHLVTFIDNKEKKYVVGNHYHCIHDWIKDDQTVVLTVDGDDALAHHEVLNYLDRIYSQTNPQIYLTYGQFINSDTKELGFCSEVPKRQRQMHSFRRHGFTPSHLRTFYAWLFKKIRKEDLMHHGNFPRMSGDIAMMFPMMEMANGHFLFIPDVLYVYNRDNPISDNRENAHLQVVTADYFRIRTRYKALDPIVAKAVAPYIHAKLIVPN